MRAILPSHPELKLQALQKWTKLRQDQLAMSITISKDTVIGYLKRQMQRGNWHAVEQILKGKPMATGGEVLLDQLRDNIVKNLMLRMGLRKVVAVGLAMVLLPLIIAKVTGEIISRFKK